MRRFLWWLFPDLWLVNQRLAAAELAIEDIVRQTGIENAKLKEALAETITELNTLRNNLPAVLTAPRPAGQSVRQFRSWSETKAALQGQRAPGPQPIQIERTS